MLNLVSTGLALVGALVDILELEALAVIKLSVLTLEKTERLDRAVAGAEAVQVGIMSKLAVDL